MGRQDITTVILRKSQRVLDYDQRRSDDHAVCFSSDGEDDLVRTHLYINRLDMQDFGQPLRVTVTIEPGDLLNTEGN